jgi:hypothetical protein
VTQIVHDGYSGREYSKVVENDSSMTRLLIGPGDAGTDTYYDYNERAGCFDKYFYGHDQRSPHDGTCTYGRRFTLFAGASGCSITTNHITSHSYM